MISNLIGKPYRFNDERVRQCWAFCQQVMGHYHIQLPDSPKRLRRIESGTPEPPCIVLFALAGDWHAGVVVPGDGLHFIHIEPLQDGVSWFVKKESLTAEPWKRLIKGYYCV